MFYILLSAAVHIHGIPEVVKPLLVSVKHVPQVEVQSVGCVPVLELLEVGVLCESHVVQSGLTALRCAQLAWLSGTEQVSAKAFRRTIQIGSCPSHERHTILRACACHLHALLQGVMSIECI